MDFNEWLCKLRGNNLLCASYSEKVDVAKSKKQLMDIVLDANGSTYLCEMDSKGFPLPYEVILKSFSSYINGRYIAEYKNDKDNGYTSTIYCCYSESDRIDINTTLTTLLGCVSSVYINEWDFCRIYADKNCDLKIYCPPTSRCIIEYWKGAKIEVMGNYDKVELIENE